MTRMRKATLLLISLTLLLMARPVYPQDSMDMFERCKQEGSASVINQFTRNDWDMLGENIASGDSLWIETSACLNHGIYYGGQGDFIDYGWWVLTEAWMEALLKNPAAILQIEAGASLGSACRLPPDSEKEPIEFADGFLEKALAALEKVDEDYLETNKKACKFYLMLDYKRVVKNMSE